eukprot:GHVP01067891.1.p1 GENE.GHVP01067891.1~~GHVP01067891.1.p1  ORF type:complete len:519 (+),score=93.46 GHVP01067891.1:1325-2881(+)
MRLTKRRGLHDKNELVLKPQEIKKAKPSVPCDTDSYQIDNPENINKIGSGTSKVHPYEEGRVPGVSDTYLSLADVPEYKNKRKSNSDESLPFEEKRTGKRQRSRRFHTSKVEPMAPVYDSAQLPYRGWSAKEIYETNLTVSSGTLDFVYAGMNEYESEYTPILSEPVAPSKAGIDKDLCRCYGITDESSIFESRPCIGDLLKDERVDEQAMQKSGITDIEALLYEQPFVYSSQFPEPDCEFYRMLAAEEFEHCFSFDEVNDDENLDEVHNSEVYSPEYGNQAIERHQSVDFYGDIEGGCFEDMVDLSFQRYPETLQAEEICQLRTEESEYTDSESSMDPIEIEPSYIQDDLLFNDPIESEKTELATTLCNLFKDSQTEAEMAQHKKDLKVVIKSIFGSSQRGNNRNSVQRSKDFIQDNVLLNYQSKDNKGHIEAVYPFIQEDTPVNYPIEKNQVLTPNKIPSKKGRKPRKKTVKKNKAPRKSMTAPIIRRLKKAVNKAEVPKKERRKSHRLSKAPSNE